MCDGPTRNNLENVYFYKATLDKNLKFKYENCNYKIYIPFDGLPKFNSITLETLYDGKRKVFRIVSNRKDHDHKDRENVGRFIHLLAAKYKYDLLQGMEADNAGFLHIYEIERLNEDGYTDVPSTIYRSLKRLLHNAQKSNSAGDHFLSKFLFGKDQLSHLICCCGNIGSGPDDPRRNTWFWLKLPAENIKITDGPKDLSDDQLRERLSLLFPDKCLLTKSEAKKAVVEIIEPYPKSSFVDLREDSKPHIDNIPDSRFVEFREMLKQEAISHLNEKLHSRGLDDYIPLDLQMGLIKESGSDGALITLGQNHNRIWEEFDFNRLQNPQGFYILSSEVGSGKTTFLRNLQLRIIKKTGLIPIFLEALELESLKFKKRNSNSFLKSISDLLNPENSCYEFLKCYQDQLVFLIDGLDQIEGAGTEYKNLVEKLQTVVNDRIILTSRPFAAISKETDGNIKFLRLKEFKQADTENYFGNKYSRANKLCKRCLEMLSVPMLAYMIRFLIEKDMDKRIDNLSQLYKRFVDYIFEDYNHQNLKISEEIKIKIREVLGEISYKAIANKKSFIQKIPISFIRESTKIDFEIDKLFLHGFLSPIIDRSSGVDTALYFSHQSFQEYLAAEFISQSSDLIQKVLTEKWNPKWKQVLKFLVGIKGQIIIKKILSEKDNPINSKLFLSAELVLETNISSELREQIWQKAKKLFDEPLYIEDIEIYLAFINVNCNEIIDRLVADLSDTNKSVSYKAIGSLEKLKDNIDVNIINKIAGMLDHEDANMRRTAADILGVLKDKIVVNIVNKMAGMLGDKDSSVSDSAAMALAKLKDKVGKNIINKIDNMLDDKDVRVRCLAVLSLGFIEDKLDVNLINKIVNMLDDKDANVHSPAAFSLGNLKDKVNANIVNQIVDMLDDKNADVRIFAVNALGELKYKIDTNIINQVTDMLDDNNAKVRLSAAISLVKLKERVDINVVNQITDMLDDNDAEVRCLAAFFLGKSKDRVKINVVNKIADALHDKEARVRISAVNALGKLKDKVNVSIVNKMVDMFCDKDADVRRSVAIFLEKLKDKVDKKRIVKIITFKNKSTLPLLRLLYQDGKLEFLTDA